MEYAKRGDLHGILASTGPLMEASVQLLSGEILNALDHIHDRGYVYGDLKPENVLVHESGHVKLGDFGAARRELGRAAERGGIHCKLETRRVFICYYTLILLYSIILYFSPLDIYVSYTSQIYLPLGRFSSS